MDRAEFVTRFGGIFEHSAWIAARAFDSGDLDDVYSALVAQFRMASEAEKLGVLRAHPDLAGKLAIEQFQEKCVAVFGPELRKNDEQFQEKCVTVFRPELRKNDEIEQFQEKCVAVFRPELRKNDEQFQEKCVAVFGPELRKNDEQFQEKCVTVFRPELRKNDEIEQFQEKCVAVFGPELRKNDEQFQEKCVTVFRPELRKNDEIEQFQDSEKNGNALAGGLTADSKKEQAGAGLDRLSAYEYGRFADLNHRYVEKFGFPFIIAVKGLDRHDILSAFEARIHHTRQQEFEAACQQVEKIARLRLDSLNFGDIND